MKPDKSNSHDKSNIKYRAYRFSLQIIDFISHLPHDNRCRIIGDQLLRSATSIGANIVEAKSSSSRRDFIKYYEIALKSANETAYWLCLLRDTKLAEEKPPDIALDECVQLSKMIASSLLTLKGKKL